jgi:hypothetical protein
VPQWYIGQPDACKNQVIVSWVSLLCYILAVPLFITWCYDYSSDFSQHPVHSWWCEMAGHMMQQWCDHDSNSKAALYLRLEITYQKLLQPYYFLCKASGHSKDVRFQHKQGPHSYEFSIHFFSNYILMRILTRTSSLLFVTEIFWAPQQKEQQQ